MLRGQCGADESLRAEVEKLIESHQQASAEEFIAGVAAEENAGLFDRNESGPSEQQSHRLTKDNNSALTSFSTRSARVAWAKFTSPKIRDSIGQSR